MVRGVRVVSGVRRVRGAAGELLGVWGEGAKGTQRAWGGVRNLGGS